MSSKYPASPTETERCIESVPAMSQRDANSNGNTHTHTKKEFLTSVNTELASLMKNQKDPGMIDHMMKKLDQNSGGQLDCAKFLTVTGGLPYPSDIIPNQWPLPETVIRILPF